MQTAATVTKFARAAVDKTSVETILETVGDLSTIQVMQNMVLVATYIRPEKTKGGLFIPESSIQEDVWQGKVGLVLKLGPTAFVDDEEQRFGEGEYKVTPKLHDWCVYRVGDAWDLTLRGVACRLVADHNVRLVINDPEEIY